MTTRYVGPGGSDANNGLTWATRKLTLNGVEDTPVVAGDTVYVGPGTYRETLTVDISGSFGNPITYIGDYTGANTDGVGGIVRLTGSDNDQTATRASCIVASSKSFRTFRGFQFDTTTGVELSLTNPANWVIDNCYFGVNSGGGFITVSGAGQLNNTIQNCYFGSIVANQITFTHSSTVDNTNQLIQSCVFAAAASSGIIITRIGGITVKNCDFVGSGTVGVFVVTALSAGQVCTVNNCVFTGCNVAVRATVTTEFVEDFNQFYGNSTNRTNVNVGANSLAYPALFDTRWFFQIVNAGAGPNSSTQVISPYDLSSATQFLNVTGTNPPSTDMRGTSAIGNQRDWGALEYDSTLNIKAGGGSGNTLVGSIFGDQVVQ